MDYLAKRAEVGLIRTVAQGLKPGSDVANMSVLGFDPMKYYTEEVRSRQRQSALI